MGTSVPQNLAGKPQPNSPPPAWVELTYSEHIQAVLDALFPIPAGREFDFVAVVVKLVNLVRRGE